MQGATSATGQPGGGGRLSIILVALLILIVAVALSSVVGLLQALRSEAGEIDVAGRQRMLNQRLQKEVLLESQGTQADYRSTRAQLIETLGVLRNGGTVEIPGRRLDIPPATSDEIVARLDGQQELLARQTAAAEELLESRSDTPRHTAALAEFRSVSSQLERDFDAVVALLAARARAESTSAQRWTIAGASLVLLLSLMLLGQMVRSRRLYRQLGESEERLELAFEGSSDGVWDWNVDNDSTYYSTRFKELLGFSDAEFPATADAVRDRMHADDRDRVMAAYDDHFERRVPFDQECRLERKDGGYSYFRVRGRAVWADDGTPTRMVGAITNIDAQKAAGNQLEAQAMEARLVHEATTMAAETDSFEDALQSCVDTVCEITGWPVGNVYVPARDGGEDLLPTGIWHLRSESQYEEFREVTDRTPFGFGVGLPGRIWKSGEPAWITNVLEDANFPRAKLCRNLEVKGAFGFPIKVGGELVAILEFFADEEMEPDQKLLRMVRTVGEQVGRVLERKRSREELRRARDAAEEANRSKSQFLANMSHELRTPLNSVIGFSNILLRGSGSRLPEKERSFLERIQANGVHLLSLINEVLDISKIEAGRMELETESVEVESIVREVMDELQGAGSEKALTLGVEVPEQLTPILADRSRLKQVLINLVGNAIKFTDGGSVTVRVATAEDSAKPSRLEVVDTGIGIRREQLDSIFDSFRQADGSTTRKYSGTGLGLTISRSLCRLMGFDLIADSEPGSGSTFTVLFDGARAGRVHADLDTDALAAIEGKHSVLVIDDDPDTRVLLSELLSEMGCEVFSAESGEEGLKMAKEWMPELITLDLMMPGMSGWEVLHRLKSDPDLRDTPVVVVSIVAADNRGTLLGALDVISKPIRRQDLKGVLARVFFGGSGRALVVEDDPDSRRLLVELLREDGIESEEAENGAKALEVLDEKRHDVVILDLMMPVMDGIEFLSRIRRDRRYLDLPVIVVTAKHLSRSEIADLARQGASVLRKGDDLERRLKKAVALQFVA